MENLRRRQSEEMTNAHKYSKSALALDVLQVLDQMDMALSEARKLLQMAKSGEGDISNQIQNLCQGLEYVVQGMHAALECHKIKRITPLGKPFNPLEHEAVQTKVAEDDQQHNTVCQVLQHGFTIEDRVLRPAKVEVAKKT